MKNGYYVHFQGRTSVGVGKKIDMQIEEFSRYFRMTEIGIDAVPRTLFQRVLGLFPTASITRTYEEALEQIEQPDFIYVRRTVADRRYVNFWKRLKEKYPGCRIIIEIFTYPYDKDDFGKWDAWPFLLKELLYRPKLKRYVDRFVTYSKDESIFGIPTIRTTNGINVDAVCKIKGEFHRNKIVMIGVAYMQRQHGYERIIEGLHEYKGNESQPYEMELYLVGDGPEKQRYQELVRKYGLEDSVRFYPVKTGQELDQLYDEADLALAAFGMYKVGYDEPIGALKTRECMAKGIPMISGSPIDILEAEYPFAKIFANDDSSIDMQQVIRFYESVCRIGSKETVAEQMRWDARERASMSVLMKPIVDFIEE